MGVGVGEDMGWERKEGAKAEWGMLGNFWVVSSRGGSWYLAPFGSLIIVSFLFLRLELHLPFPVQEAERESKQMFSTLSKEMERTKSTSPFSDTSNPQVCVMEEISQDFQSRVNSRSNLSNSVFSP